MTSGTGLYIQPQTPTPIATIIGFEIVCGIGVASLFQTPMMAVQNTVSQADTAGATATLGFFRDLAASLSVDFKTVWLLAKQLSMLPVSATR